MPNWDTLYISVGQKRHFPVSSEYEKHQPKTTNKRMKFFNSQQVLEKTDYFWTFRRVLWDIQYPEILNSIKWYWRGKYLIIFIFFQFAFHHNNVQFSSRYNRSCFLNLLKLRNFLVTFYICSFRSSVGRLSNFLSNYNSTFNAPFPTFPIKLLNTTSLHR